MPKITLKCTSLHQHHPIIHVSAGPIELVYGLRLHMVTDIDPIACFGRNFSKYTHKKDLNFLEVLVVMSKSPSQQHFGSCPTA